MTLPTKKSEILTELKDYLVLLYGLPKTGKTTLAAQFDEPLFLELEPGTKSLSVYRQPVKKWKMFTETVEELDKEKNRFKTVVIDTFAKLHDLCQEAVCKELGVEHPADAPYGKGFNMVDQEFNRWMNRISLTGRGVILICHEDSKDVEQRDGSVKNMVVPKASKQARDYINRCVDLVAYYHYGKDGQRYIRIQGNDEIMAGNRIDGHFLGLTKFPVGNSAKSAYQAFIRAFNNEKVEKKFSLTV
jgi:phage nucleotide-binding protein